MPNTLEYFVLPAESLTPPTFTTDVSPWGVGCLLTAVALGLSVALVPNTQSTSVDFAVLLSIEAGAIALTSYIYNIRKQAQVDTKKTEWMRLNIEACEKKANGLAQQARTAMESFYDGLRCLPDNLREADIFLRRAEDEFQEKAYAPFWDNIEQAAIRLGAFSSNMKQLESDASCYKNILIEQIHNFPPLSIQLGQIPNPNRQSDQFRRLVRMGQKNFDFATIWEHRKTQAVIEDGFLTLGEAVHNLGLTVDDLSSRVTSTIEENSSRQIAEQARLRGSFETALSTWKRQKRLSGK
jgi:hypothetical protein